MPALLPSELPVLARVRHHWIVMFRRPHRVLTIALLVLFLATILRPFPWVFLFALVLGATAFVRWQTWHAESIILTRRRIIRISGVPETTSTEASLRLDRISGAVLEQTVWGKILNYGSIELEAPGQHPDVRKLKRIARPNPFYLEIRLVVFGKGSDREPEDRRQIEAPPDEPTSDAITAPLPILPD
jgi:hypothetical protein